MQKAPGSLLTLATMGGEQGGCLEAQLPCLASLLL
jgi:hypothetical protein